MILRDLKKTRIAGLYYQEDKDKGKIWIVRINLRGIVDTHRVVGYSNDIYKTNMMMANKKRLELIEEYKAGSHSALINNITVKSYFENYMASRQATMSKSRQMYNKRFFEMHIPKKIQSKKLNALTPDDLQKVVDMLLESNGFKPSYVKYVKEIFSPMYKKAIREGLASSNPAQYVVLPKYDNKRYFKIPIEAVQKLYREILLLPDIQHQIFFLFLFFGRRKGEVLKMKWEHINLDTKEYEIPYYNNKNKKNQQFFLPEPLYELLVQIPDKVDFVLKGVTVAQMSEPKRIWKDLKRKANLEEYKMRFHDFRHMVGYMLINNGESIETVARTLGHADTRTAHIYANMDKEIAKRGVDKLFNLAYQKTKN